MKKYWSHFSKLKMITSTDLHDLLHNFLHKPSKKNRSFNSFDEDLYTCKRDKKINFIPHFVQKILHFTEFCNLILRGNFGP